MLHVLLSFINFFLLIFIVSWFFRFLLKNLWEVQFYKLKPLTINLISIALPALWYVLQFLFIPFPPNQIIYITLSLFVSFIIFQLRDKKRLNIPHINILTAIILVLLSGSLIVYELLLAPTSLDIKKCSSSALVSLEKAIKPTDNQQSCLLVKDIINSFDQCIDEVKSRRGEIVTTLTMYAVSHNAHSKINHASQQIDSLCP